MVYYHGKDAFRRRGGKGCDRKEGKASGVHEEIRKYGPSSSTSWQWYLPMKVFLIAPRLLGLCFKVSAVYSVRTHLSLLQYHPLTPRLLSGPLNWVCGLPLSPREGIVGWCSMKRSGLLPGNETWMNCLWWQMKCTFSKWKLFLFWHEAVSWHGDVQDYVCMIYTAFSPSCQCQTSCHSGLIPFACIWPHPSKPFFSNISAQMPFENCNCIHFCSLCTTIWEKMLPLRSLLHLSSPT